VPPATEEKIDDIRRLMRSADPEIVEDIIESMREGTKGEKPNIPAYGFTLPENRSRTSAGQPTRRRTASCSRSWSASRRSRPKRTQGRPTEDYERRSCDCSCRR